jgi:DTW domain-containing protein YfiP
MQAQVRQTDMEARDRAVRDPALSAAEKRKAQTEHIFKHGRALFWCPHCWMAPHYCICSSIETRAPRTKLVVHVHHSEWCERCMIVR